MSMNIKYVNSNGQSVNLNQYPYKMLISDILDSEPDVIENNGSIIGFDNDIITQREVNIDIHRTKTTSARVSLNNLTDIFAFDVATVIPGRLYINDWYIPCYFYGRETDRWQTDNIISCEYKLVTDHPSWIHEESHQFFAQSSSSATAGGLDFPFDFPFDFAESKTGFEQWNIDHYASSHFNMTIYGPCKNPRVLINGYPRQVFTSLEVNEYLVIDSQDSTVIKHLANGTTVSVYNSRQFQPSIFEKIPSGLLNIDWSGTFGFDITLYIERSEPKW